MNKKASSVQKRGKDGVSALLVEVRQLIAAARSTAASTVNTLQVLTNFEIGRRIVEHEQKGEKRAEYGAELLKQLSVQLTEEFGRGFSKANLEYMRRFFLEWQHRIPPITQTASGQLADQEKSQELPDLLGHGQILQAPSAKFVPFALSWSHYVLLMTIKNPDERSFYEIEATNESWSLSELKRQKTSALYERLALSRDKDGILWGHP